MARKAPKTWTTRTLLRWTTEYFDRQGVDSARLAAEMLLAHVLEVQRLHLYTDPDRPASELERAAFRDLVERAAAHEPVDYLVGKCPFFGLTFKVNPHVLVPRPSTETLVEHVIEHAKVTPGFHAPVIADVGTGSGAIAVSLAKKLPAARVIATDISADALAVAKENAARHEVTDRIEFRQGDLFEPLAHQRFHFLLSNPPYISDREWDDVPRNVKDYEPTHALRGGMDGLALVRPLLERAHEFLESPGQVAIEIAASQEKVARLIAEHNEALHDVIILHDHERLPRVVVASVD